MTVAIIDQHPEPLLSTRMTGLAQMYVDARRQQGEQLLVMGRAVALAREEAQHGEWNIWLEAVQLQERTARRLIAIHNRASISARFAEAVRNNWFNASVAALVAERDDDEALLRRLLALPEPPTAREAQALANPATLPDLNAATLPAVPTPAEPEPVATPPTPAPTAKPAVAAKELMAQQAAPTHREDTFRIPAPADVRYQQESFTLFADQVDVLYTAMQNEATASGIRGIAEIVELFAAPLPSAERVVLEPVRAALRRAQQQLAALQERAAA